MEQDDTIHNIVPRVTVLEKKYAAVDYQYFKNGNIQQYNVFRHDNYNLHLVVGEVLIPYVIHN